jgi:hypothetical protein
MPQKKVLLMIKVNVAWSLIDEFNEYWARENLPLLEGGLSMKLSVYLSLRIFHIGKSLMLGCLEERLKTIKTKEPFRPISLRGMLPAWKKSCLYLFIEYALNR